MSQRTVFLARLFGLFMTVVAVWMLVDEPGLGAIVQTMVHDRPVMLLFGMVCLASGLAVVLGHQVWSGGIAPILVTLLGWILVVRGVVLIFLPPNLLEVLTNALIGPMWLYLAGVVALGIGLILTFAGFRAPLIVAHRR